MIDRIDSSIVPRTDRERQLLEQIKRLGLGLHRVRPGSKAVRLTGPGVHVIAASLDRITADDLWPVDPAVALRHYRTRGPRPQRA